MAKAKPHPLDNAIADLTEIWESARKEAEGNVEKAKSPWYCYAILWIIISILVLKGPHLLWMLTEWINYNLGSPV